MSYLRKDLNDSQLPAANDTLVLMKVYDSVRRLPGLCHGQLSDSRGSYCAIQSLFKRQPSIVIHTVLVDQVAATNDAVSYLSKRQRRAHMLRWLRWMLAERGVPGFRK